jgi:hypothetical protein
MLKRAAVARAAVVVVCLFVLAGCKVDADITVTMKPDGSGTIDTFITLDAEAVARVEVAGRTLDTAFPLDDLKAAGWTISPWTRGADGAATLRLQHDFAGEKELDQRITELVGPTKLLRDPRLIRRRGVLRSHDELALTADLRHPSTGIQQDPALVAGLQAAGLDVATLDQQLATELGEALSVSVTVKAPGNKEETVQVLAGEQETATAARSQFNTSRLALFAIAGILAFLGVLLYLSASIGARRERARRVRAVRKPVERTPLM